MNIEVNYTGGGIWLAEKNLDNGTYAVVSSDFPECITVYRAAEEPYLPEDMIFSKSVDDLDEETAKLYSEMMAEMKKKVG